MRILVFLALAMGTWIAQAEETTTSQPGNQASKPRFTSVSKQQTGQYSLDIDYPWHNYKKPSIEIRLFAKDAPEQNRPRPLLFVHYWLNGEMSVKVGKCMNTAYSTKTTEHVLCDAMPFNLIADRNAYGKPAVYFIYESAKHESKEEEKKEAEKSRLGTSAIFCELENWSLNRHQLKLDLSHDYFADPGKLYVWFLRDDSVVWEETLDWKGYPGTAN